jgi:hypothetical protein
MTLMYNFKLLSLLIQAVICFYFCYDSKLEGGTQVLERTIKLSVVKIAGAKIFTKFLLICYYDPNNVSHVLIHPWPFPVIQLHNQTHIFILLIL